ncbi:CIC11C00000004879 [Sungouiella intermedia]|uniref:CIC11C00000004580 n=1 Tax=Sungouiella intermedia TaxID=45354 RepID=A0A1L0DPY2_9ASCO|nr:CIC11C00000004879 [[Candida] intermedia]SGZ58652.1 CIC11C00000004580 [[Candida] intermedia]
MAQGNLKLKSKGKGRVTKKQTNLRAAAPLIIKPKKSALKLAYNLKKSVGSSVGTEKLIASRVGHLEIIKGSRRQIEKDEKEAAKKAAKKSK